MQDGGYTEKATSTPQCSSLSAVVAYAPRPNRLLMIHEDAFVMLADAGSVVACKRCTVMQLVFKACHRTLVADVFAAA